MINYAAIYASLYSRAAASSAGAALRALLGGSSSLFPRKDLNRVAGVILPWLVWAPLPAGGASGTIRDINASWWIYTAPNADDFTSYTIAAAVEALYGYDKALAIAGGRIGVTFVGRPQADANLGGIYGLEVRIGYRQLG